MLAIFQKSAIINLSFHKTVPPRFLLFVIVIAVVLQDAVYKVNSEDRESYAKGELATLLYADDTLLVGVSQDKLQHLLDAVAVVGLRYGLELHPSKFQLIQARVDMKLQGPDGTHIFPRGSMKYLGCVLCADGRVSSELARRLGCAWADFQKLVQLWKHTTLTLAWKLQAFHAIIVAQALHGLSTAWLNASDRRKLDGFQARCLRIILQVAPSFISRISNQTVLDRAGAVKLSTLLLRHQLLFFGKVARASDVDVLRQLTICRGSLDLVADRFVRRVGRPRNEWASCLYKEALKLAGGSVFLQRVIQRPVDWKAMVSRYCAQPR